MAGIFAISDVKMLVQIQINKFRCPDDYYEQVKNYNFKFFPELLFIRGDFSYKNKRNIKKGGI